MGNVAFIGRVLRALCLLVCLFSIASFAQSQTLLGSLTLSPTNLLPGAKVAVVGGQTVNAIATLSSAAPTGGLTFSVTADQTCVSVPSSIFIPSGSTTNQFQIQTTAVGQPAYVHVYVSSTQNGKSGATLFVVPQTISSFTIHSPLVGGTAGTGTVQLAAPATTPVTVSFLTNNYSVATVPASLTIPTGSSSVIVPIYSHTVTAPTSVTITAYTGIDLSHTASVMVTQNAPVTVTTQYNPVLGGFSGFSGSVTLALPAPSGGMSVSLSSNKASLHVPASLTVPAGYTYASFGITTDVVASNVVASLTASNANGSAQTALTILAPYPEYVKYSPPALKAGSNTTGTVYLYVTPIAAVNVTIQSVNSNVSAPTTVTIPAGQTTGTFLLSATSSGQPVVACPINLSANTQTFNSTVWLVDQEPTLAASGWPIAGGNASLNSQGSGPAASGTQLFKVASLFGYEGPQTTLGADKTAYYSVDGGFARDGSSGTLKWATSFDVHSAMTVGSNGLLYADGNAIDQKTGQMVWSSSLSGIGTGNIGPNGLVYFAGEGSVSAFDGATGKLVWTRQIGDPKFSPSVTTPVLDASGHLFVVSFNEFLTGAELYALDTSTGATVWGKAFSTNANNMLSTSSNPVVSSTGDVLVNSDTSVYVLNGATGALKSSGTVHVGTSSLGQLAIAANGTIYAPITLGSGGGALYALDPTAATTLWQYPTTAHIWSAPSIASDGTLYLAWGTQNLDALDPTRGTRKWTFTGGANCAPAIARDGTLYFGNLSGFFYGVK